MVISNYQFIGISVKSLIGAYWINSVFVAFLNTKLNCFMVPTEIKYKINSQYYLPQYIWWTARIRID